MQTPKPEDFPLLLEVFRQGLRRGLISRDYVISWAEDIIKNTDEPDCFFIEVSLSSDLNRLIEVLNNYHKDVKDNICPRVLISEVYRRIINDDDELTVEGAAALVGTLQSFYSLTPYEQNMIYCFEDYEFYYLPDETQLQVELINFLLIYKDFNLQNYEQWPQINELVEETLKEEAAQEAVVNEANTIAWQKIARKRKIKKNLKIGAVTLFFIGFIVLDIIWINGQPPNSGNVVLYGAPLYVILRWGWRWWRRKK